MKEILTMVIAVLGAVALAWLGVTGGIFLWQDMALPQVLAVVLGIGLTAAALFLWFVLVTYLYELLTD